MDERLATNRANWDDRVPVHLSSNFYDVEGWLSSERLPLARERAILGDVTGKTLVHLQCHLGLETLQWARAGAIVTGVDFSPSAIEAAMSLRERTGLSSRSSFICCDVYDAHVALAGNVFDIVYVSIGSLGWLPDVGRWAHTVTQLLAPGGTLFVHDVHPFSSCFDDDGEKVIYGYFEEPDGPLVSDTDATYTDGPTLTSTRSFEWNHSLSEIVQALRDEGLLLEMFEEHDWTFFQQYPWLIEENGVFRVPADYPSRPLTFTLLLRSPMTRLTNGHAS